MVNLANIMNNFQSMGPVFWAGATAIALGGTLLMVSMITMLRRIKLSAPGWKSPSLGLNRKNRKTNPPETPMGEAQATARKTESGYEPAVFPLKSQSAAAAKSSSAISFELTDRLHRAADTLEEMILGLQKETYQNNFSPLKDDNESVEYLFKTSVG